MRGEERIKEELFEKFKKDLGKSFREEKKTLEQVLFELQLADCSEGEADLILRSGGYIQGLSPDKVKSILLAFKNHENI
jgi:hypothetical protein